MLDLHNRKRAGRGLGRLRVHPALMKAVGDYSREKDFFSDRSSNGETFAPDSSASTTSTVPPVRTSPWGPAPRAPRTAPSTTGRAAPATRPTSSTSTSARSTATRRRGLPASEPALAPVHRRILTPHAAAWRAPHQNRLHQKRIPARGGIHPGPVALPGVPEPGIWRRGYRLGPVHSGPCASPTPY
jgi:hypothetical protein